jgi:chitin synthase
MLFVVLAALQLGSKRNPELQDKFVLCQVPCYTEGEDSLRRTIDSLAALNYDDKRKLIFIICDGNIIGSGNDRTTPRIVLDILGVDPKLDPEPLLFKSVGEGSRALNYGKVYSGLYEFEGHVVPSVSFYLWTVWRLTRRIPGIWSSSRLESPPNDRSLGIVENEIVKSCYFTI